MLVDGRRLESRIMMIVELNEAEAWSTEVEGAGLELRVMSGTAWVTQEGDGEDHVVRASGVFITDRGGRVAIQALTPVRVAVTAVVTALRPLATAA